MATRAWHPLLCAVVVALAGCGGGGSSAADSSRAQPATATATPSSSPPDRPSGAIEGSFDVGGHRLYVSCAGTRAPTVVYLHGFGGSSASAGIVPRLLGDRRVCVYDRANVGRSGMVPGPVTGADHVRDLHALLRAAKVPGPYVLLGASLGGLIAQMYAAVHPRDVAGMVLLDAVLPGDLDIDRRLAPKDQRPSPDDWKRTTEYFDVAATLREAHAIAARRSRIPVTYLAADPVQVPPGWPARRFRRAVRREQRAFVGRFSRGRLAIVDAPHYMEPVIPERIAREVRRVVAETRRS
jgi:pimeloyl-ACP methyl ester carboxylesterase